jgi:hypothetical protein
MEGQEPLEDLGYHYRSDMKGLAPTGQSQPLWSNGNALSKILELSM